MLYAGGLSSGYGQVTSGSRRDGTLKNNLAHRVVYEEVVGRIPEGMQLDHLCRVRNCVNPEHLRPVTIKENVLALGSLSLPRLNLDKTHCPQGHAYDDANTIKWRGERACRACRRASWTRYNHKRRGKVVPS